MADLAVGLAKSVVEGTLSKAQAAIEQEAKLRQSAQRDLVFITGEFQMMQSFLNVADAERVGNQVVMTWVRQIRELAYDVEDCIEFVVHLDKKNRWWLRLIPSCISPAAPQLDEAVDEIEQLKARVEDVSKRNTRYNLISDTGSKPAATFVKKQQQQQQQQQQEGASGTAVGLGMLIGAGRRQQQEGDLTQLLANANEHLRVISVWGTGGDLGVTSIIWKAYNDQEIRQNFACRAWVKLMHPFNPREFVQCLMDQFYANTHKEPEGEIIGLDVLQRTESEEAALLKELAREIKEERYLIVLEDLSSMTEWDAITKFFPAKKNGSCIIVSTQHSEVASLSVGHPYQVLDLNHFSVDHSVHAFYKEGSQCDPDKGKEIHDKAPHSRSKNEAAEDWMAKYLLVGRESEINDLHQYTTKARFDSIQVMSVWGIAGVGKSALVKNLFCDIIRNKQNPLQKKKRSPFSKYGWVDVSHPFNLRDFARSLLLNLHSESLQSKDIYHDMMGSKNPIIECQYILKNHKCLVVIDGIKSTKEWDMIQAELVSGSSRNFIIVITTEATIAKHCRGDRGELVFNVKGLEADSAFELFKKEVSSKHPLPSSLSDCQVAELKELISKCGGLPKVIVEIARSLGTKSVGRMDSARSLSNKFMHDLEKNREFDGLQGLFGWIRNYFRTCPDSLKPCIFYLSIFPRDQIVRRRRLVRRWIAEGYSRDNYEESAEFNGEKHFSDLLDLSIIQQPPTTLGDTRMVRCQVNGFVREYIVSRRMEENLVFELGGSCTLTTQRTGRHLVILESWDRDIIVFESIDFSRLRSLTVFGKWQSFFISESMKLLRVLDLEDATGIIEHEDLEKIVKVFRRLKFLSLRGRREINHLPSSLAHLRQLQTLDVRDTSIVMLPESITKLQKLQYIRAGSTNNTLLPASTPLISSKLFCRRRHLRVGVEVPRGIGKLTALHTLGVINVAASGGKVIVQELKKLTQLRKLGVSGINKKNSKDFFSAIKCHVHLESLSIHLDKDNQGACLDDMMISLPLENLVSLKLYGLNEKLPEWSKRLSKLRKLNLEMGTLTENDMKLLGKLPELCILRVKQLQEGELHFRVLTNGEEDDSYQKVKVLEIACSGSSSDLHVTFGSKTMKKLELLKVDCSFSGSSSVKFSGLENLKQLKEVLLVNGSNAETFKQEIDSQLAEHTRESKKPVVKVEESSRSS